MAAPLKTTLDTKIETLPTAPVLGGTVYAQVNYLDAETHSEVVGEAKENWKGATAADKEGYEVSADKLEAKNWGIALGYAYPFSKRTNVYGVVTYSKAEAKADDEKIKPSAVAAMIGLRHNF